MLLIARTHIEKEREAIANANRYLFIDTTPLTTLLYSQHLFKLADPELEDLSYRHYDFTFLCGDEFEFIQDGTRQDARFRSYQQKTYVDWLNERQEPYILLTGDLSTRLNTVASALAGSSRTP